MTEVASGKRWGGASTPVEVMKVNSQQQGLPSSQFERKFLQGIRYVSEGALGGNSADTVRACGMIKLYRREMNVGELLRGLFGILRSVRSLKDAGEDFYFDCLGGYLGYIAAVKADEERAALVAEEQSKANEKDEVNGKRSDDVKEPENEDKMGDKVESQGRERKGDGTGELGSGGVEAEWDPRSTSRSFDFVEKKEQFCKRKDGTVPTRLSCLEGSIGDDVIRSMESLIRYIVEECVCGNKKIRAQQSDKWGERKDVPEECDEGYWPTLIGSALLSVIDSKDMLSVESALMTASNAHECRGTVPYLSFPCAMLCGMDCIVYGALSMSYYMRDIGDMEGAKKLSFTLLSWLGDLHGEGGDVLRSRAYGAWSFMNKDSDGTAEKEAILQEGYQRATLLNDKICRVTIANEIMRTLIASNSWKSAWEFMEHFQFPREAQDTVEYCRWLFYTARVLTMRLSYATAIENLTICVRRIRRKAHVYMDFHLTALKHLIVVTLVNGQIPQRSFFNTQNSSRQLAPYYRLVQAVRTGDQTLYQEALTAHESVFETDGLRFLVGRLGMTVIRAAVQIILQSYSAISLEDIRKKLNLDSLITAHSVVIKVLRDSSLNAYVDAEAGTIISGPPPDIAESALPIDTLNQRIEYCLQLYSQVASATP